MAAKIVRLMPSCAGTPRAFMRRFAGRTMRFVGNHRGARTISLALGAGFVAFEAALAIGAGAIGIPGLYIVRFVDESAAPQAAQSTDAAEGGESVFAKLHPLVASSKRTTKPAPAPPGEPRLDGLSDIPMQEWVAAKAEAPEPESLAEAAKSGEALPWDAVEPVPFDSGGPKLAHAGTTASLPHRAMPDTAPPVLAALPADSAVEGWVKAKATEVKAEYRARRLYHFEFWLDAPDDVKRRLVAVAYDFNTPAVMPQSQISSEKTGGFRISAGGLVCADKVTVTLKFNDGRKQQVAVDGCKLLG